MRTKILLSHPFGNANVRQAALALVNAGMLEDFRTCINVTPGGFTSILPKSIRVLLERRAFPVELTGTIHRRPLREMGRLLCNHFDWKPLVAHETGFFCVDAVTHDLDRAVAREIHAHHANYSAVYAYEDGAKDTFLAARTHGLHRFYDLPIGYWRAARDLLTEEALLQPEWATTLTTILDSEEKMARKDREIELAEAVIVASRYTAKTLAKNQSSQKTIHIIPYGAPPPQVDSPAEFDGPLRVLFVGSLGQRKGVSYLLQAAEILGTAMTLTLLGTKPDLACFPLENGLRKHTWIRSLPHAAVLEQMRQHDVLVFPSLFEGFGLVILEALSQGIPVITTSNTGGPDVLTDESDGFIVPIRDSEAIAKKLEILLQDRNLLTEMKAAALRKARRLNWENYRRELVNVIDLETKTL